MRINGVAGEADNLEVSTPALAPVSSLERATVTDEKGKTWEALSTFLSSSSPWR